MFVDKFTPSISFTTFSSLINNSNTFPAADTLQSASLRHLTLHESLDDSFSTLFFSKTQKCILFLKLFENYHQVLTFQSACQVSQFQINNTWQSTRQCLTPSNREAGINVTVIMMSISESCQNRKHRRKFLDILSGHDF